jgi:hypothetical protein
MESSARRTSGAAAALAFTALAACSMIRAPTHRDLATVAAQQDPLALSDALEALIANSRATSRDREYAYRQVRDMDADTAGAAFGHAAIIGRKVQLEGLRAAVLVREVERYARRSRELDPTFRDGAATRMLGTLYVMAPATLLRHGDSETGLELLEELTAARPDVPENHLRLAEAYIALNDPDPAAAHLCFARAHQAALRPDDRALLNGLTDDAGPLDCPPAPPEPVPDAGETGSTAPPAAR